MFPLFKHIGKRHKGKDIFENFKMWALSEIRWLRSNPNSEIISPNSEYEVVFEDDFLGNNVSSKNWGYAMPWGDFHPGTLHQYYDNDGTLSVVAEEGLVLKLRNTPKTYKKSDLPDWRTTPDMPDEFTIPTGVGFIHSKEAWKYGWFEALIKLPKGSSYWGAFWTSGKYKWPPEIDIFESYSHKGKTYENALGMKDHYIEPNLHYGKTEEGTKAQYGPYNIPVESLTERFVQYACHWEKDFIKIYYDGHLVFQCTDPKVLKWFNEEGSDQFIVLNHGVHEDYPQSPDESDMIVRKVKVWQKKWK